MEFSLNIFDPAVRTDPYPVYAQMREAGRVLRNPYLMGQWMVHRHEDVQTIIKDASRFSSVFGTPEERAMATGQRSSFMPGAVMLSSDPPDHTRLRGIVSKAFTPRSVARLEPRIEALARELLAPLRDGETIDLVSTLSSPLPVVVIAEMLGVSTQDRDDFAAWSHGIIAALNPLAGPEEAARAEEAGMKLREYFDAEIARRKSAPADDLVGRFVEANAGGVLSHEEMLSQCILLLLGGNETTTNLISNAALALARHPEQRARLTADPELFETAIEECLRFDSPVQGAVRTVVEDTDIAGTVIPAGSRVVMSLGAANRDPNRFDDPDTFDVGRDPNPHLAFGHGPHFCLGANLARLEARVALRALLDAAPDYQLADPDAPIEYGPVFFFRSPQRLQIHP